jgi:SnoaL-like polyketide cyclase
VGDALIRRYYACFNDRRFGDAAELIAPDAIMEYPPYGAQQRGPACYLAYAAMWTKAFPDGIVTIEHVEQRGDTICEVDLVGHGTHLGDFDLGSGGVLKASGVKTSLRFRELLEIRRDRITFSSLSFGVQTLLQ